MSTPRIPEHSPTVAGRWLAADLRKLRTEAGLKQSDVAEELGCTHAKVGHLESGRSPVRRADLLVMMPMYGVPAERRDWYLDLCAKARQKGWWDGADGVPSWFSLYLGLESGAERSFCYDRGSVPGLLQTRAYVEAIIAAGYPDDPDYAAKVAEQRVQRQQILDRDEEPLKLIAIVDEAALRHEVGDRKLMREQWNHLVDMAGHPQVTLQVVPFASGAHAGQHGSFKIFDFSNPDDPGVVYLEVLRGGLYLEENDELADYRTAFDRLESLAWNPDDSVEFLKKLARSRT